MGHLFPFKIYSWTFECCIYELNLLMFGIFLVVCTLNLQNFKNTHRRVTSCRQQSDIWDDYMAYVYSNFFMYVFKLRLYSFFGNLILGLCWIYFGNCCWCCCWCNCYVEIVRESCCRAFTYDFHINNAQLWLWYFAILKTLNA